MKPSNRALRAETVLTRAGNHPQAHGGIINPPIYRASTILAPDLQAFERRRANRLNEMAYGLHGNPTHFALEEAMVQIGGGHRAMILPSGLGAISVALLGLLQSGDHLLLPDTAYGPTRALSQSVLRKYGVATDFYDPAAGEGIAALITPKTRVVYVESPGSLTFEVQDIPAIARAAQAAGAVVVMDNTWATPLHFRPFDHGVDVAVYAATKYFGGHSDLMLGAVVANEQTYAPIRNVMADLGYYASPDDVYVALRGLRTMAVRLAQHERTALMLANWLRSRPEVLRALHPALPDCPGHPLWQRDFRGASGLFSIVLKPVAKEAIAAMLDGMTIFGMGSSWGGYESLIMPVRPEKLRSATKWDERHPVLRIHAGLEHGDDLIADLEEGFARLRARRSA